MSLLDDLKKKAEQLQTTEQIRSEEVSQNIAAVDKKLREIFSYLEELAKTLAVIKPEVSKPFVLGDVGKFEGLRQSDYFADYRLCSLQGGDRFDNISFRFKSTTDRVLQQSFDDALLAERFEKSLWEYNIPFKRDDTLNAQRKIIRANFRVSVEVRSELIFQGEHDVGTVKITCKNAGRFGLDELLFDVSEIDAAWLDELARFVMTEPNHLRQIGKHQQAKVHKQPVQLAVPEYEIHETPEAEKASSAGIAGAVKGLWEIWKK